MTFLLLWLALPLLVGPWLGPDGTRAPAGQMLLAGAALAALWQGAATLDPVDLHQIALQSSSDAWFVALSCGVIVSAALLTGRSGSAAERALGVPLALAALLTARSCWLPLAAGIAIGALPSLIGARLPALAWNEAPLTANTRGQQILATLAVVALAVAPIALGVGLLIALVFGAWRTNRAAHGLGALPISATLGTVLLLVWTWFALTIAGSWRQGFAVFAREVPLSESAGRLLAVGTVAIGVCFLWPWPGSRRRDGRLHWLAAAFFVWLAAAGNAADGMAHWQPIVSVGGLLLVVAALLTRRWVAMAAVLSLLAATRTGEVSLAGAALAAALPALHAAGLPRRVLVALSGAGAALVIAAVLRDEVLVGVVLAAVLAALAHRPATRVATA